MGGLGFYDFCLLTPNEFQAAFDAYCKEEDRKSHEMWECMRILAAVSVAPFAKGRIDAKKIIHLPWDDAKKEKPVSKEEDVKALANLLKRIRQ